MKINSIVNRYIFREFFPPFLITILFLVFVFLMTKILKIVDMVINYNVGIWDVFCIILYTIPYFLVFILPISTMLAVLMTFLRMTVDNELIALKAGGVEIYSLLIPVLCFCIITTGLTFGMAFYGTPWGRLALKALTYRAVSAHLSVGLKERVFNTDFKDVTLYVNRINNRTQKLTDVFIEDRRTLNLIITIVAPRGFLVADKDNAKYILRLLNGTINQVNLKERTINTINFGSYDHKIDLPPLELGKKSDKKDHTEMTLFDFQHYIHQVKQKDTHYHSLITKYYYRWAVTFSCFALGLLAVPLGCLFRSFKGSLGIGLGIFFLILYYALMSVGKVYCETGISPPAIVMWVPNAMILLIAGYFFHRSADNRGLNFFWCLRLKGFRKPVDYPILF